jgi:hypothetical protein
LGTTYSSARGRADSFPTWFRTRTSSLLAALLSPITAGAALRFAPSALRGTSGGARMTIPGGAITSPRARRTGFYHGVGAPNRQGSGPFAPSRCPKPHCQTVLFSRRIIPADMGIPSGAPLANRGGAPASIMPLAALFSMYPLLSLLARPSLCAPSALHRIVYGATMTTLGGAGITPRPGV